MGVRDPFPARSLRVADDGRIGVPPIPRIFEGIAAMTPTEMEEAIKNLQLQANRIEQFLPTLATHNDLSDLRRDLVTVRDSLRLEIQDTRRQAVMLNEATRDEIKLIAENLSRVEATIGGLQQTINQTSNAQQQTLSALIGHLASQIATRVRRRKNR
jgi:hypothetical protein